MNKGKILNKLKKAAAVTGMALVIFSQSSSGQIVEREYWSQTFLSKEYRPRWFEQYENFGTYDIRRYPRSGSSTSTNPVQRGHVTPVTYDQFGNFLLPGGEIFNISWNRSKLGATQSPEDSDRYGWQSALGGEQGYRWVNNVFNNLVVASDEFSNWQTRFILARRPDLDDL